MKKSDRDFLIKFAAASSAAFLLSGCTSEIEHGPSPDSRESAEAQDSAVTAPEEQHSSRESNNAQDSATSTRADQPAFRPPITAVLYGPPPNWEKTHESELKLSAIYWNPSDPLVTINDENYRVGDIVNGYKILEIRKTEVLFINSQGEKSVKQFYDYL